MSRAAYRTTGNEGTGASCKFSSPQLQNTLIQHWKAHIWWDRRIGRRKLRRQKRNGNRSWYCKHVKRSR